MTQEQIEQTLKTRNEADKTIEELTEEMKKIDQKSLEEKRQKLIEKNREAQSEKTN